MGLAIGVLVILVILILPLPPVLLDLALAISIILSILILMTALFIHTPLEFSAFPTVLLFATLLRLALNVAVDPPDPVAWRRRHDAAGHVIEAFGHFVIGGNFVVGVIVFVILVIVNFVVITKGAGRIAEVAARFTLDAMPGKQMAIDADLIAGLINENGSPRAAASSKREADFYGAMDGASQVRARRRRRRPAHRRHQRRRRHHHRRGAEGHVVRRRGGDLHGADDRRRSGDARCRR